MQSRFRLASLATPHISQFPNLFWTSTVILLYDRIEEAAGALRFFIIMGLLSLLLISKSGYADFSCKGCLAAAMPTSFDVLPSFAVGVPQGQPFYFEGSGSGWSVGRFKVGLVFLGAPSSPPVSSGCFPPSSVRRFRVGRFCSGALLESSDF